MWVCCLLRLFTADSCLVDIRQHHVVFYWVTCLVLVAVCHSTFFVRMKDQFGALEVVTSCMIFYGCLFQGQSKHWLWHISFWAFHASSVGHRERISDTRPYDGKVEPVRYSSTGYWIFGLRFSFKGWPELFTICLQSVKESVSTW